MPAKSEKQKHFFQMVEAIKKGAKIDNLKNRDEIEKVAKSMALKKIKDFTRGKK